MKYYIVPLGCQMNRSDAERVRSVLDEMGYTETDKEDDEEIIIKGIIACSVRQQAIDRVYGKIRKWNQTKNTQPLITFVSGCVLPLDRGRFLKLFDLVFPMDQLQRLPEMIQQYGVPTPFSVNASTEQVPSSEDKNPDLKPLEGNIARKRIEEFWQVKPRYGSKFEAFIPIQNGCDKFCTFCAVPYTRGRELSRPSADILRELRSLVEKGYKSITLLGQNVNSYGLDRPGEEMTFPELMRNVGEISREMKKTFWTYFTSPHPRDMTRDLLEVIAEYPSLANWIHLPLQSGDDKVLIRMNRNHSINQYRHVVKDIRQILPNATLFTDIIVGFPGETDTQFDATAASIREFRYDMAYIARYSPRPGARSARWKDDVDREKKDQRFHTLSQLFMDLVEPVNQKRIGQIIKVLVTAKDRKAGYLAGYTEGRIPVRIPASETSIGDFVNVEITAARPLSIAGRITDAVVVP